VAIDTVWARVVVVGADGDETAGWSVRGPRPDLATVETLARHELAARRNGRRLRLREVRPELVELLELAGLSAVLDVAAGLGREMGGQAEGGEQVRVEEGVEAGDPPV